MSVALQMLKKRTEAEHLDAPCPSCHSAFRWLDRYGVYRCLGCHYPPSRILVARIDVLTNWGLPGVLPGWETHWEPPAAPSEPEKPYRDGFTGGPPDGWTFAVGNRTEFGCRHSETRGIPCRNGEWLRIECVACGRPIEIVDNVPKKKSRKF